MTFPDSASDIWYFTRAYRWVDHSVEREDLYYLLPSRGYHIVNSVESLIDGEHIHWHFVWPSMLDRLKDQTLANISRKYPITISCFLAGGSYLSTSIEGNPKFWEFIESHHPDLFTQIKPSLESNIQELKVNFAKRDDDYNKQLGEAGYVQKYLPTYMTSDRATEKLLKEVVSRECSGIIKDMKDNMAKMYEELISAGYTHEKLFKTYAELVKSE